MVTLLLDGLLAAGVEADLLVCERFRDHPRIHPVLPLATSRLSRLRALVGQQTERWLNRNTPPCWYARSTGPLLRHPLINTADIIHLHNVQWPERNLSFRILPALAQRRPLVWTLHDMWAMTGHCTAAGTCDRWASGCGNCPDLRAPEAVARDTTASAWSWKRRVYARTTRLELIAPSSWSAGVISRSPLLSNRRCTVIGNPISPDLRLVDRSVARQAIGLPADVPIVLFVSNWLPHPIKGGLHLPAIMERLRRRHPDAILLLAGHGRLPMADANMRYLGVLTGDWEKSVAYSAADLVLNPSLGDSFSLVTAESLVCGTPVAAYATGGITDVIAGIDDGAPTGDVEALALKATGLLSSRTDREALRASILNRFSIQATTDKHLLLYRQSIGA